MSRPIKFRAWAREQERFVYFEFIANGWCLEEDDLDFSKLEPWKQFTGLLDKNGKEIYEGDVIEGKYENRFEVWWCEKEARWETRNDIVLNGSLARIVEPEVIGNIYENPEALRDSKV